MSHQHDICLLYVTCADAEEAKSIASKLLEKKLIACANILLGIQSIYHWEGAIEQSDECVMIAKTTIHNTANARDAISSAHSYECPCILEIPVSGGHTPFLTWVEEQVEA